ncbi:TetR/AcrR family transcriptional regulator [Curtobacterium ammoniigenes]|uniref:TetR/AcrR family transcriptional regulator n=1 Tax=Curtobacterium ammoniigenes TaxID=395387 RepID=UPI000830E725|nr:TetR/AcrR family transcriptional regulator [Curtobacterium ammoniigenes]
MTTTTDRRRALRARHREAIVAAARALIAEGSNEFSVDELAERADVSRRTVFNHFRSLDEIVVTVGTAELQVVVDQFLAAAAATPVGDGSRAAMFTELAETLRAAELGAAISRVSSILGGHEHDDRRGVVMTQEAFARTAASLQAEVQRRNPGADPLDVELLVTGLFNGIVVIAKRWLLETHGERSPAADQRWLELLSRLLESIRSGYLPES